MQQIPTTEPIELPTRRQPAGIRGWIGTLGETSCAQAVCTVRNVAGGVLAVASVLVGWTTVRTTDALGFRVDENGRTTAMMAGILVGSSGGGITLLLGTLAIHILRIVPVSFASRFPFPCQLGAGIVAGMIVGATTGGVVADRRWNDVNDFVDAHRPLLPGPVAEAFDPDPYLTSNVTESFASV